MKHSLNIWILLLVLFTAFESQGQNARADLEKINKAYVNLESFYLQAVYRVYTDPGAAVPAEEKSMIYKKSNGKKYYKMQGTETLDDGAYFLSVDHIRKSVILDKTKKQDPSKKSKLANMPMDFLDTTLASCEHIEFLKVGPKLHKYIFTVNYDALEQFAIVFDRETYYIKKLEFYIHNTGLQKGQLKTDLLKAEVEYVKFVPRAHLEDHEFSLSGYIEQKNGQFTLVQALKTYSFLNLIN